MLKKKQFKLVADTFQLKVFLQEGLLKIRLDDKIEFITYGRSYTEDDIGQQIHRKMDIQDVYYSLSKPVDNTQSQNKQGQEREVKQIETYYFDNIVRFGQNPCFKIQTGGIITVYKEYYDEYRSKKIVYESILCLDKIKDLGEKGQIRKLNQQLWQVKKENDILKEILSLSQQRIQKLEQLLKQEAIKNQNEVEKHQQMNKLIEKNKQSTQILQKQWKRIQILKGLPFPNMHHYTISINNIITFITNWGDWIHYIFNDVIPYGQTYSFKLNIIKLTQKSIMVGVCDYEKQKITYSSYGSGNAVCYYGVNGFRCPDGQIQGTGLEEKETVEVIVNLSEKSIRWLVNGYERSSFTHEILGDASRKFYPYFELKNQYDSVEWMPK